MLQQGAPEDVYQYPTTMQVAQFLAKANVLAGTASDGVVETGIGRIPLHKGANLSGAVEVVLRPESVTLVPNEDGAALVEQVSYFGFHQLVQLRLDGGEMIQARTWSHTAVEVGNRMDAVVEMPVVAFARTV